MTVGDAHLGAGALPAGLAREAQGSSHALVLSGGGANGAYEVGVVRALYEGASPATGHVPLQPQIFTGTSVGAYNAAFLAQDWASGPEAAGALDKVWRERIADTPSSCGNGVYRLRVDPLRWVEPGCAVHPLDNLVMTAADSVHFAAYSLARGLNFLTSDEPLRVRGAELFDFAALISDAPYEKLLADTIDLGGLARSPSALRVVATDWQAGRAVVWDKAQIVAQLGTDAIKASSAIPGLFPPVMLGGKWFVDGALRMNTPLKPAIAAGANVLHAVYVDPKVVDIPIPKLPYTLDTLYRTYVTVIAASINSDIFTAELINEDRELAQRLGMTVVDPGLAGLRILQRILQREQSGQPYRPLTVHRYRPKVPLSDIAGLLNFGAHHIEELIAQGYEDAVRHDCRIEECILPPARAVAAGLNG